MRISDWSSDVCSSDLLDRHGLTFRETEYMETSKARVDVDGVFLNVNVDIGPGTITNVAGYRFQRSRLPNSTTGMGSIRTEEHTSELQSLMRNSYAVFCLKKKKTIE